MHKNTTILTGHVLSGLYAITDASLMPGEVLFAKVKAALRGGCRVLQYRRKDMDVDRLDEAQKLGDLCRQYQSLFIVNDDVELARQVNADGVHIGQTDTTLAAARHLLGDDKLIGVSCHNNVELAWQAQEGGASYVAFGRFFPSYTKPQAPVAGLEVLACAKQRLHIPVVAIGGITRDNAPRVIEQGADMIAVIHELFATHDLNDVEQRAKTFSQLFF